MSVSLYAEPAEYAGERVSIGVGTTPSGKERVVLTVIGGQAVLTVNECRAIAEGLLDAIEIEGGARP